MEFQKHLGTIALGASAVGIVLWTSFIRESSSLSEDGDWFDDEEYELGISSAPSWNEYVKKRQRVFERESVPKKASSYLSSRYGGLGRYFGRK